MMFAGICRWFVNNHSKGQWTVYMNRGAEDSPEVWPRKEL